MKRIRVEMDVPDGDEDFTPTVGNKARFLRDGARGNVYPTVRSVEVVEPVRYTRLVLEREGPPDIDDGEWVDLAKDHKIWSNSWRVVSVEQREEHQ